MVDGPNLTHVDAHGKAHMVDVGGKATTRRTAVATGKVILGEEAFTLVSDNQIRKGDVLTVAQIAGIQGAKQTSNLIPLCHAVALQGVDIEFSLESDDFSIFIRAFARSTGPTGVEMEALTAVSVAALTVYDMCKSVSKDIMIGEIQLLAKTGGQSGDYRRPDAI